MTVEPAVLAQVKRIPVYIVLILALMLGLLLAERTGATRGGSGSDRIEFVNIKNTHPPGTSNGHHEKHCNNHHGSDDPKNKHCRDHSG